MSHPLFGPEVREMLAEHNADGLRAFCESLHPATIAEALDDLSPEQIWEVISPADIRTQAAIFEYLPIGRQVEMVEGKARPQVGQLLTKMSHDDRADLLRRLPGRVKEPLLRLVDEADRRDIATLVTYGENTVGALMTTDYAWLPPTATAAEAVDQLRRQAPDKETIYYIYVLDDPRKRPGGGGPAPRRLLGVVSLRDLILAPRHALIKDLMDDELVAVKLTDDREAAADVLARYDFLAVPVVDDAGGMVGIVTHDDVIDVIQQEATEDLQKQAGVSPIEGNYLDAGFWTVWYSRAKWLTLLFGLQMGTINVMAHYEGKLGPKEEAAAGLAFMVVFIPLCLSVGGNAGSQAATLVTRAIALGQVRPADWPRVLRREVVMAVALAGWLGLLSVARTYLLTPADVLAKVPAGRFPDLVWVVSLAVVGICLTGALVGAMFPVLIAWLGGDPALMSSPFIATLSDVLGIVIFFNIVAAFFL